MNNDYENINYSDDPDRLIKNINRLLYKNLTAEKRELLDEILIILCKHEKMEIALSKSELDLLISLYLNKVNCKSNFQSKSN